MYELEADDTDGDREGLAITCPNGCTSHPAERERERERERESMDLVCKGASFILSDPIVSINSPQIEIFQTLESNIFILV